MTECDFYLNIYDDFVETRDDENDKILWKMYNILKLMKLTNANDPNGFMENGLRMIMLLYKNFRMNSCDLYSFDLSETAPNEKEYLQSILKTEFI